MTVSATTSRADYTGNGATLAFTIPFYFLDNTHVKIIRTTISTGVPTTLALTTDYTLSGAGSGSGGTATMVVAPTTDQRIAILRNVPFTQLIHYVPNDPFPAATHEQALDQLTMEVQQINETVGRALTLDASVVNASGALPAPTANAFIGWNANATGFQNYAGLSNVTVSSAMQPVVQAVNISTARTLLNSAVSGANNDITSMGNVTVPTQTAGNSSGLIASTAFVSLAVPKQIQNISADAVSNTMVVSLNPTSLEFRNTNLSLGGSSTVTLSAVSNITIPQSATLGAANATPARIAVGAINNNGTMEPVVLGSVNGIDMTESSLLNTTAISTTSNSSNVPYSTSARSLVPVRWLGYLESNQAVAGTYATRPALVQGIGGNNRLGFATVGSSMVRLNTVNGYGSTNTAIRRFTNVVTNQGSDITYADSATLGALFTINTNGVYAISYSDSLNTAAAYGVSLNSSQLTTAFGAITVADKLVSCIITSASNVIPASVTVYLTAGSLIRPHASLDVTGSSSTQTTFTITRVA